MKRQFTVYENRKPGSGVRLRVGKVLAPDNARKIGIFKSIVVFENWFKMVSKFDILKLIISKTLYSLTNFNSFIVGQYMKVLVDLSH